MRKSKFSFSLTETVKMIMFGFELTTEQRQWNPKLIAEL